MRRYRRLAREWRAQTLGRRTSFYVWALLAVAAAGCLHWTPTRWRFAEGVILGMFAGAWLLFADTLLPDHIARWQRGAWGEQETAKALKPLRKRGWLIRHDLTNGYRGNRDHIAAGPAVYLLDSKLLKDEVWVDAEGLHVRRLDSSGDEYVSRGMTERMSRAAWALKRDLEKGTGFPVAVYPVVVIWAARFDAGVEWDRDVAYVAGERLAGWLENRRVDLHDESKRRAVQAWLQALPHAS